MTLAGAGGLTGVGREHAATLLRFNHLPEEHNDMIFAVVACRWGLLGSGGRLVLVPADGRRRLLSSRPFARDLFGRLLATGLVTLLLAQMVINTGMTIGLLPITGMTLPFVSAGGSSLLTAWLMIGLVLNVGLRRPQADGAAGRSQVTRLTLFDAAAGGEPWYTLAPSCTDSNLRHAPRIPSSPPPRRRESQFESGGPRPDRPVSRTPLRRQYADEPHRDSRTGGGLVPARSRQPDASPLGARDA